MVNVLAPPWPTSPASGVFSKHGFSQSSSGNPIQAAVGDDLKVEIAVEEDGGDGKSSKENIIAPNNNDNNTQESFSQQILSMTQNNNELTQLGADDDMYDDCDDNDESLSQDCCHSPIAPVDPLTLPWGRLMPVGTGGGGHNNDGRNNNDNNVNDDEHSPRLASSSTQQRGPTEMLPRSPTTSRGGGGGGMGVATRSRSPSLGGATTAEPSSSHSQNSPSSQIHFLGLKNLIPGDRFNEYVIGRSVKADVTALKMDAQQQSNVIDSESSDEQVKRRNERRDYVHAMVSNRHCRIFCVLGNDSLPDLEVFVEDTSGNGTLINGTTLLRKYERRRLHTGDVICLLNPKLLGKKVRSIPEQKSYINQYSYVFVNLYEQEARHGWGVMSVGGDGINKRVTRGRMVRGANTGGGAGMPSATSPSISSSTRKTGAVVNVRATKCHSIKNGNTYSKNKFALLSSLSSSKGLEEELKAPKNDNATAASTSTSLNSFLTNKQQKHHDELTSSDNNNNFKNTNNSKEDSKHSHSRSRARRIEEEYDLRDLLGTGTCGEVRRAIHRRTGEERAVKIISINGGRGGNRPSHAGGGGGNMIMSPENLTAIQAEAEILRSLDHPYVVKLYDTYISLSRGTIYLVMELIRGGDLFDRIVDKRDGRYTEVQARRLFRRILSAVHYLHEDCGIVHRDLKPENILVVDRRSDVNIKLTDFGLAKNMTSEGLKTFCGTPQYFAPEVLRRCHTVKGDGRYGKEIDCWSIGVILFILLSGSPPFDVSAGFESVANAKIVFYEDHWKQVSLEARDLVVRLLEKDPRRRLSVKNACGHAWVLIDDGDTHCHPLHDPVVISATRRNGSTTTTKLATSSIQGNFECHGVQSSETDANFAQSSKEQVRIANEAPSNLPSSPLLAIDSGISLSNSAPNQISMRDNVRPEQICVEAKERQASIWAKCENDQDENVTKVIHEACHILLQLSPNGSPIQKRQLFDEPYPAARQASNHGIRKKKITKQDLESIKAAGNTLPTPIIDDASRLMKKIDVAPKERKKKQSTLFDTGGMQHHKNDAKSSASKLPEIDKTSTVTPSGGAEQNKCSLVFRLNKKHGGKYISPEARQTATQASANGNASKAELSDDELRDFSDDDVGNGAVADDVEKSSEKKPLEKYLNKKRKMESIERSSASVNTAQKDELYQPISKSSTEGNIDTYENPPSREVMQEENQGTMVNIVKNNDRKTVQTFLFGRPPSNNIGSSNDDSEKVGPPIDDGVDRGDEIQNSARDSAGNDGANSTNAVLKGKQMPITSWFQRR